MVLLLGATGYVGKAFQRALGQRGISFYGPVRGQRDYGIPWVLGQLLDEIQPTLVICAAGFTGIPNVEAAERQKIRCLEANLAFPVRLSEACAARGIPLGHVSSGCIYSGCKKEGQGWCESDLPNFDFRHNNSSFYSGCKALAEEMLRLKEQVWIWRLRRPFNGDAEPRNYLSKIMGYPCHLESENSISQIDEFTAGCLDLAMNRAPFGIYNMTNPGVVRTSELTALLVRAGLIAGPVRFFADSQEFVSVAGRTPRSECVLDSSKALAQGVRFTEIHEALERSVRERRTGS
ncbi:MAG: sugar nucleotide-binding protein [Candidatus Methylacidiphilales bacterium]|nr:sugar nucleotide-binding protein [Candidatus Methylacidiphilales bacterium]